VSLMDEIQILVDYTCELSQDRWISQGGGGNVSVKVGSFFFVKRSGCRLSSLLPSDLVQLSMDSLDVITDSQAIQAAEPSIEYKLHAAIPHKYILHIHDVGLLRLMLIHGPSELKRILKSGLAGTEIAVTTYDYARPGDNLANLFKMSPINSDKAFCALLENHGVVYCANSLKDLQDLISSVRRIYLAEEVNRNVYQSERFRLEDHSSWLKCVGRGPEDLMRADLSSEDVSSLWRMYPDNIVYLGVSPKCIASNTLQSVGRDTLVVLTPELEVFVHKTATQNQIDQLQMFFDVFEEIWSSTVCDPLDEDEAQALYSWEKEVKRRAKLC